MELATEESARPVMSWVSVIDDRGREHLEMRWQAPASAPAALTRPAA